MRTTPLVMLVVAAALLAGGCGGSKKKNAAATTTTQAAATTTEKASTGSGGGAATTSSSGSSKLNLSKADSSCKALVVAASKFSQAMQAAAQPGNDVAANAKNQAKVFDAYAKAAPSEIKSDLQAYASAFDKYAAAMQGVHLKQGQAPKPQDLAKLQAAGKAFSGLGAHSAHLQAWAQQHCGAGK